MSEKTEIRQARTPDEVYIDGRFHDDNEIERRTRERAIRIRKEEVYEKKLKRVRIVALATGIAMLAGLMKMDNDTSIGAGIDHEASAVLSHIFNDHQYSGTALHLEQLDRANQRETGQQVIAIPDQP